MNIDIKSVCAIVSVILSLCTFIGGAIGFCIIKFNDFSHIEKNMEKSDVEITKKFDGINEKLDKLVIQNNDNEKRIAVIDERCKSHKIIKRKK